jgi:hypothetical protein
MDDAGQVQKLTGEMNTETKAQRDVQKGTLLGKNSASITRRISAACRFWCMGTTCGGCMRFPIIPRISYRANLLPAPLFAEFPENLLGRNKFQSLKFE